MSMLNVIVFIFLFLCHDTLSYWVKSNPPDPCGETLDFTLYFLLFFSVSPSLFVKSFSFVMHVWGLLLFIEPSK